MRRAMPDKSPLVEILESRLLLSVGDLVFDQMLQDGMGALDGLWGVVSVTVSPDGGSVYAAGNGDNAVAVFSRDAASGLLTFQQMLKDGVGGVDGLALASSVTVSPDGGSVYAAGRSDNAVAVFSRNPATGLLTFQQVLQDGVGGVDGLAWAASVTVSPDGGSVYAAGESDNAVAAFSRNPATGLLTFQQMLQDGVGGVDGLALASSVTVSPDGGNVYAAGAGEKAVGVFSRNPATGLLTFQQVLKDGVGGVDGLAGASSVTVSPDGGSVFAAGNGDNAVAVFSRTPAPGFLTFQTVLRDGVGKVDGLWGAVSVTVSPDGGSVYAAGQLDNAVAVFSRAPDQLNLRMADGTLTWTDLDGTVATASLKGGTADVTVQGFRLMASIVRNGVRVTGFGVRPDFDLSGATLSSTLSFTTKGGTIPGAVVGTISGAVPVGKLVGPTIDVCAIDMTGTGYIASVQVRDIIGAGIRMAGSGAATGITIKAGRIAGASIYLASGLKNLTATQVDGGSLSAPWAGSIIITGDKKRALAGDMGADVTLSGAAAKGVALATLTVAGTVKGMAISAPTGSIGAITAGAWNAKALIAKTLGSFTVKGDFQGNLTLTDKDAKGLSLTSASIAGWLMASQIRAKGSIGTVTVGGMNRSLVFAGVTATSVLPGVSSAFEDKAAAINSLVIKCVAGVTGQPFFAGSLVAAATIKSAVLRDVDKSVEAGFRPFGLAADTTIGSLTIYTGKTSTKRTAIAASLADDGDFCVRVV